MQPLPGWLLLCNCFEFCRVSIWHLVSYWGNCLHSLCGWDVFCSCRGVSMYFLRRGCMVYARGDWMCSTRVHEPWGILCTRKFVCFRLSYWLLLLQWYQVSVLYGWYILHGGGAVRSRALSGWLLL